MSKVIISLLKSVSRQQFLYLKRQLGTTMCAQQSRSDPLENLKDNKFYNKYAKKLQQLQQDSPGEFDQKVKTVEQQKQAELEEIKKQVEEQRVELRQKAGKHKNEGLNAIMKVDLLKDKTSEEITTIWNEHHKAMNRIYAVIPKAEYEEIYKKSQEFPTFIYPIPRGSGYEFFLQQFNGHKIIFTPLIQFQTHHENAPNCLTITHYTDLADDKGIVLMEGEPDTKVISIHESQLLAIQVKMYYGLQCGVRFNFVRIMNNSPDSFKHMDLVKEFENYKKDYKTATE